MFGKISFDRQWKLAQKLTAVFQFDLSNSKREVLPLRGIIFQIGIKKRYPKCFGGGLFVIIWR